MADKGILVADATSGESVGCVDLQKQDDASNNRIVQLVSDVLVSHADTYYTLDEDTNFMREVVFGAYDSKSPVGPSYGDSDMYIDLLSLTNVLASRIDIRDASAFMIYGAFHEDQGGGTYSAVDNVCIKMSPFLFNNDDDQIVTMLPSALVRFNSIYLPTDKSAYNGDNDGTTFLTSLSYQAADSVTVLGMSPFLPMVWPTYGAARMGIHVVSNNGITGSLKIYCVPLSGANAESALAASHFRDKELSSAFFRGFTF